MKKIFSGRCLWDFSLMGEVIILDDDLSLPVGKCVNKIIITHSPTPDIIFYMQHAVAVVAETGGVLCHAAVLAMEIGCPIIVGVGDIIHKVENGKILQLEGKDGVGIAYEKTI